MAKSDIVTPEALDILEGDIQAKGSVSEALLRKIAASLNAANYYSALPLGTVLENFIPPTDFYDLASTAYVEINGQDVTTTDYGQWRIARGLDVGTVFLPDGRGMEFVQVNGGRNDGHENSTNLNAGQFQDQRIQSHSHKMFASNNVDSGISSYGTDRMYQRPNNAIYHDVGSAYPYLIPALDGQEANAGRTSKAGSSQTNSKRIAVYRYIKVWNVAPDL